MSAVELPGNLSMLAVKILDVWLIIVSWASGDSMKITVAFLSSKLDNTRRRRGSFSHLQRAPAMITTLLKPILSQAIAVSGKLNA